MSAVEFAKAAAIIGFGATEGYAFFRTGLTTPSVIVDQMTFSSFLVLKLFMSGVGTSMIAQGVMDFFHPKQFAVSRIMTRTSAGFLRAASGCFLLGVGMTLAGSGPTIVPAQIGAGSQNMPIVLAGALAGGAVFSFLEKALGLRSDLCAKASEITTLDAKLKIPYYKVAFPAGVAIVLCALVVEYLWPHERDVARMGTHLTNSWSPVLAGAFIGLNQLPLRYLASRGQGGSTAFMNVLSTVTGGAIAQRFSLCNVNGAAQFLYVWLGTTIGSFLARSQQPETFTAATGPDVARAFLGGMLLLLGARFAGGCTCGHGISGTSELSFQSFAAAASIFAGGIAAAQVVPKL